MPVVIFPIGGDLLFTGGKMGLAIVTKIVYVTMWSTTYLLPFTKQFEFPKTSHAFLIGYLHLASLSKSLELELAQIVYIHALFIGCQGACFASCI